MSEDYVETLEKLMIGEEGLLIKLRLGEGLQKSKVQEICQVLTFLRDDWFEKDVIPKRAAELFVDFYAAMESSVGLYSEEKEKEIMDAADQIMDLIRQCVQVQ